MYSKMNDVPFMRLVNRRRGRNTAQLGRLVSCVLGGRSFGGCRLTFEEDVWHIRCLVSSARFYFAPVAKITTRDEKWIRQAFPLAAVDRIVADLNCIFRGVNLAKLDRLDRTVELGRRWWMGSAACFRRRSGISSHRQ
ncbi:MAG: hypothetical protein J0H49_16935 [Acidobacteria bacterium]|nr:hypothetical protein [Acidobacteriota bacterium]